MRKSLAWSVLLVLCLAGSMAAVSATAAADVGEQIAEADRLFDRWSVPFNFEDYEVALRSAIDLWTSALTGLPEDHVQSRSHVLNRLSQAYFELATGYLTTNNDKEAAYELGKDAALESLRLDPTFDETEASDGFRAALRSANDVEAIFWYGNTLGQWLNYHQLTAIMGGVKDVAASFERAYELDESYDGAGPHRALGSLIAQAHFVIGRDRAEAVYHFERCTELAPDHLEARVSYVSDYLIPTGDADLAASLLAEILELASDPDVMAVYPFYNRIALERATELTNGG